MTSEETTTAVAEQDLAFVESLFERTPRPLTARELAEKLAFEKTASQRTQDVKLYDPACSYDVGDQVYKEYDEALMVSSKTVEPFKGAVVLRVIGKAFFKAYDCEMLEVDFAGGGVFRKYVDYMKKTKTQVLLPSSMSGEGRPAPFMAKDHDPRLTELPMTDRDLRALEKSLRAALAKSPKFFGWNDAWQLAARRVEIPDDKIQALEEALRAKGKSAATEELVRDVFAVETSSDLFDIHCLSLNYALGKKHKKEFLFVSPLGWGKWLIKSVIVGLPKGLPLAAPLAPFPELDETAVTPPAPAAFPLKVYLSWREILSGGIKVPRSLAKELSHAREYTFTDPDENKPYTVYYFPNENFFLGLRDFYSQHNIPQGSSLTLERTGPTAFKFWVKKSKKKMSVIRLGYDAEKDEFVDAGEEAYTFAEPNKIIYIERETLASLMPLAPLREGHDLRDLVVTIYGDPGLATSAHTLHFLRAYHLIDIVRQTTQEDVEFTLLNSPEFTKSDKKKGVFTYHEPYIPEEEAPAEAAYPEGYEEPAPEAYTPEEAALEAVAEELFGVAPETVRESPRREPSGPVPPGPETGPPLKKDKTFKRKKPKTEGDKGTRPKKSERRVIEEKIAEEESERAALAAVKEKEEETPEQRAGREKKEEFKPAPKKEAPKFGIFGDLLKTALKKKPEGEGGETPEAPEEQAEEKPEDTKPEPEESK